MYVKCKRTCEMYICKNTVIYICKSTSKCIFSRAKLINQTCLPYPFVDHVSGDPVTGPEGQKEGIPRSYYH